VNPRQLRIGERLIIPVSGAAFDPRAAALAEESEAPRRIRRSGPVHVVRSGESWWTISRAYGVAISDLRRWNGASATDGLRIGQKIRVTGARPTAVASRRPSPSRSGATTHRVRYGETLSALAERFGTTVASLRRTNAIAPGEPLRTGMVLRIPGR
jgi:LysM repeat protein